MVDDENGASQPEEEESLEIEEIPNLSVDVAQKRETFAGILAVFLWIFLGGVIFLHMMSVTIFAGKLVFFPSRKTKPAANNNLGLVTFNKVTSMKELDNTDNSETVDEVTKENITVFEEINSIDTKNLNQAVSLVEETAKTLYTFLTPLATAVTAYFFRREDR